jgi:hypothetical protein
MAVTDSPLSQAQWDALSSVWGRARGAANFSDINWQALGLPQNPLSGDAQRLVNDNWGALKQAKNLGDINWLVSSGYHPANAQRGDALYNANEWKPDGSGEFVNQITGQRASQDQINGLQSISGMLASGTKWSQLPDNGLLNWEDSGLGARYEGRADDISKLPISEQRSALEQLVFNPATSHGGWAGMSDIQRALVLGGLATGGLAAAGVFGGAGGGAAAAGTGLAPGAGVLAAPAATAGTAGIAAGAPIGSALMAGTGVSAAAPWGALAGLAPGAGVLAQGGAGAGLLGSIGGGAGGAAGGGGMAVPGWLNNWGSLITGGLGLLDSLNQPDSITQTQGGVSSSTYGQTLPQQITGPANTALSALTNLYGQGYQRAPLSPLLQQSANRLGNLGSNPFAFPGMENTAPTTSFFADGQTINPYLDQVFNAAADSTQNRLASEFASAGRFNSGNQQQARSQELQNLAAGIYAPGYEAERSRQYGATEAGIDRRLGQTDSNLGRQYGAIESNLGRDLSRVPLEMALGDYMTNYNQSALDAPWTGLDRYMTGLGGLLPFFPGTQTQNTVQDGSVTNPLFNNPLAGFLGGSMLGRSLFGG